MAWGNLTRLDVTQAVTALEAFDIVLLMESFDDPDQAVAMLSLR